MNALDNTVEILDRSGEVVAQFEGPKADVATGILNEIQKRLIESRDQ